jgi:phage terminase large subunit-like protein
VSPTATKTGRTKVASRRSGRTAHKPLRPFTVDHFRKYALEQVLDNGERWDPEDFQLFVVEDVFAGVPEVWMVVPEGNGKTTLMGGFALYHADFTETAAVLMAAASRDQCGLLLGQAAGFVYRSPQMQRRFRVFEGYRRISALRTNGRIQVFAADDRTGDGVIPTLGLLDELHRHPDMRLYRTWRGKLDKRGGQLVGISTAGEPDSEFEDARERIKLNGDVVVNGAHTRAANAEMVLHDWGLRRGQDVDDLELVAAANPFSGVTAEKLARRKASPTMTAAHWARFVCNLATAAEGCWLPDGAWDACCEPDAEIPDGESVWLGVDIGRKHDHTALVALWNRPDGKIVAKAFVMETDGETNLDLASVEQKVRDLGRRWHLFGVVYDPWSFERSAQLLTDEGFQMVEHPMSNERMVKASSNLYEAIQTQRLVHDGNRTFAAHVMGGHQKDTERGWRLAKNPKVRRHIDALIALCLGFVMANQGDVRGGFEW